MRYVLLTPGTGSFFCGTCLRDNALAMALRKLGHTADMVPMYLPPTLDEASAAESSPLFYGGINVYLQQASPLFRKTPRWLDALVDSPGALAGAAKRAGMTEAKDLGPMTLSMLQGENGHQLKELERLADWLGEEKPDVVILSNALLMGLGKRIKEASGAQVACTLQGEDTFIDALPEPYKTQSWEEITRRASDFDAFIAVSQYHADLMTRRANLPKEKVHVVHNGILLEGYSAPEPMGTQTIGFLSRMCPAKGLHLLVDAFCLLGKRMPDVRLAIGGAQTAGDIRYVEEQKAKLEKAGVLERVSFHPNMDRDEKIQFLRSLTVFSVPALYGESFGLYLLEALAAGVPVVQPNHAAFPEVLGATGGGVLFEPYTPEVLANTLEELLKAPEKARTLGAEGRKSVFEKFSVDAMAKNVAAVFDTGTISS
ncbi:MAG: glycosyltransferase family 4 protein [Armatimonas sp.]